LAKKGKTLFVCQNCGHEVSKWQGRCPGCGEWNTLVEEVRVRSGGKSRKSSGSATHIRTKPRSLRDISTEKVERILCGVPEFDRVMGGGIIPGVVVLIAGEPGIGKSTLMLQAASHYCERNPDQQVLYVSGEESPGQLRLRAERLGISASNLYLLPETDVEEIAGQAMATAPLTVIIDSVQTLYSPDVDAIPGSVAQLKECGAHLVRVAKEHGIPLFLIGHVTKSGVVAGPRLLEHLVDAVIYFEGDSQFAYRVLRVIKNRFGPADEVGIFEMKTEGLVPVENPSGVFIEQRAKGTAGSIIAPAMEGSRTLLVEIQALTSFNGGVGAPRRDTSGGGYRRVGLVGGGNDAAIACSTRISF